MSFPSSALTVTPATRVYTTDAGLYLIRDVCDAEGRFLHCEYGALEPDSNTVDWIACDEGVSFNDIAPLIPSVRPAA